MTERVAKLLGLLHSSRGGKVRDKDLDALFRGLDDMMNIASMVSLARNLHGQPPIPTEHVDECNSLFEQVDVEKVHEEMLANLLRVVSSKRSLFPAWEPLRDRVRAELTSRGEDVEILLHGL